MRSLSSKKGQLPPTEEIVNRVEGALSAKEAARELDTDARTFRKFMRATTSKDKQPGQGNRYAIDEADIPALKKKFVEWSTKPAKVAKEKKPPLVIEEIDLDGDE